MKKTSLIVLCSFVCLVVLIGVTTFHVESKGAYECFGWSSCDDDLAQHCATSDEYVDSYLESSHCVDIRCFSTYSITCEDLDDGGFYYRTVTCEAYDSWNCEFN